MISDDTLNRRIKFGSFRASLPPPPTSHSPLLASDEKANNGFMGILI